MSRASITMIRRTVVVTFLLFLFVAASPAVAQNCDWDKVKSWTGHYSITQAGTVSQPEGVYTINNSFSADFAPAGLISCAGQNILLSIPDPHYAVSANDKLAVNPCGTETLTGTSGLSQSFLVIDPAAGTYSFIPNPNVDFVEVQDYSACGGSKFTNTGTMALMDVGDPWPFTFPLPGKAQSLQQSVSFQAADPWRSQIVGMTFTFTLTPTLDKDDKVDNECGQSGGSVIGCQNQTLGEDVPIVGTDFSLHYQSDRLPGRADANSVAKSDALATGGWTVNVHHAYDPATNALFLGDGRRRSTWQLAGSMTYNGNTLVTSEDGSEIYLFDLATGRHVQTVKPLTGAVKYQFTYDGFGNVIAIKDGSNNVTAIQRNGSGRPTAIVSPFGQTTTLTVDGNGFLTQVADPAGHTARFTNNSGGLMTSRTDANGNVYNYTYDGSGLLTNDSDPAGGFVSLTRTNTGTGYNVTKTTASGRTTTYGVATGTPGEHFTNIWPSGLQATVSDTPAGGQLSESSVLPDGTSSTSTMTPDPRWGLQAPIASTGTLALGSLTASSSYARNVALAVPGNPFSLTSQTDTAIVNGRTYTSAFTTPTKTYLDTTAAGRTTTRVLDSLERLSKLQVSGMAAMKFTYDTKGRLSKVNFGPRITKLAYGSDGLLSSSTDPLNLTTTFTRDLAGRLTSTTLPDGRVINYNYDANGNLVAVTPPGKSPHDFSFTSVNLVSTYLPPAVTGGGPTTYGYNLDRDLTSVTRPDGQAINFSYDSAGRLASTTTPTGVISYVYDSLTGNLNSTSIGGGEAIAYSHDGPLATSTTWAGTVAGSVGRAYNNNFWVTSENINGANTINFTYDDDGLLKKAGALVVSRNPKNGLIKGATLGKAKDTVTSNTFGEPTAYSAKYGAAVLFSDQFVRDAGGRIAQKTETIGGVQNVYGYSYDQAGRLVGVTTNGVNSSSYSYDTNSNRLVATTTSGTATGTYDAQDRALTYGNVSFTYSANGERVSRTAASQTTTYTYDVLGNLTAVHLPTGVNITYVVDARNRRVGKRVNGALQNGFLYDHNQLVAQLDGGNQIVSQFLYGTREASPDVMIRGGVSYRIFSDHLGSTRLVVNSSTGAIVQRMDYDEFGNVLNDTNPGFQPFGFAGGLYDPDTKLVRFGARDYDPVLGRWTAKDPILFAGGDTNLYGYVLNDPVNLFDPSGLADECSTCKDKKISKYQEDLKNIEEVWKIVKKANKLAKIAIDAAAAQKAMAEEAANPSLREYKFGLEQAKERSADSVAPASTSFQGTGKTCVKNLNPD
ncbi:MAG: RHS repeat-associated core domain-containing protein [Acidobacteria bacterium]|nr:RHS repeat-associated core domain-containing protein [Acidobacteriota bacterium]